MAGLIRIDELATMLNGNEPIIVDCRYSLSDAESGYRDYRAGHIPQAHYLDLVNDLSGRGSATAGRHPLPQPGDFAELLGNLGVRSNSHVVAYDDCGGQFAARFWWLCRWLGLDRVGLLDGGWQAWLAAGKGASQAIPAGTGLPVEHSLRPGLAVSAAELKSTLAERGCLLVDARAAQRYRGEVEPIDPVAGHIPGAINHPCANNLDDKGQFLLASQLRDIYQQLLGGRSPEEVIHSCGSGVTACHNLFAMELAGLGGSRLFAPSWSGWIADQGLVNAGH